MPVPAQWCPRPRRMRARQRALGDGIRARDDGERGLVPRRGTGQPPKTTLFGGGKEPGLRAASVALGQPAKPRFLPA
jgi:hypothetical protein